jgi:hypothetical protein
MSVQLVMDLVDEHVFHCGLYSVRYDDSEDEDDDKEGEEEEDWQEVEADSSESDEEEEDEEDDDDDGPSSEEEEEGGEEEEEDGCEALKEDRWLARHCRLYGKRVRFDQYRLGQEGQTVHEKAGVGLEAYASSEDDEEEDETEDEDEEEEDEEEMEKELLLMVDVKPVLQEWARRSGLGFATSSLPWFEWQYIERR